MFGDRNQLTYILSYLFAIGTEGRRSIYGWTRLEFLKYLTYPLTKSKKQETEKFQKRKVNVI